MKKNETVYVGEKGNSDARYERFEIRVLEESEFYKSNNVKFQGVFTNLHELSYFKEEHSFDELKDYLVGIIGQIEEVEKLTKGTF